MQGIIPGNLRALIYRNSGNFLVIASHHWTVSVVLLATQPNMSVRYIEENVVANHFMSNIVSFSFFAAFLCRFWKWMRSLGVSNWNSLKTSLWGNCDQTNIRSMLKIISRLMIMTVIVRRSRAADVALTTPSCSCSSDVWQLFFKAEFNFHFIFLHRALRTEFVKSVLFDQSSAKRVHVLSTVLLL